MSFVAFSAIVTTAAGAGAVAGTAATGITLGEVALGATAIAGGFSAYGAYQQGQAQKNMMNYQAQSAAVQQDLVKRTAAANTTAVFDQASRNSTMLSRQQSAIRGAQAAAMGGQGVGGSVTSADIAKDTFTKQEMDQQTLMYNANIKAWNITNNTNNQLWGLGAQEEQYQMGAKNAETAGNIGAGTSLLSSASQIGSERIMLNTQGAYN